MMVIIQDGDLIRKTKVSQRRGAKAKRRTENSRGIKPEAVGARGSPRSAEPTSPVSKWLTYPEASG
jgi:hypothetical protein